MSWDNYAHKTWHVDHIKPMHLFDLTNPEQLKIVCHYTNLRPLWAKDNLSRPRKDKKLKEELRSMGINIEKLI